MDVDDFVEILTATQNGRVGSPTPNTNLNGTPTRINRLAVIDPNYIGYGFPAVTFEGESAVSSKTFACATGYRPTANDRVLMVPVGTTYMIVCSVANNIASAVVSAGPLSYYQAYQDIKPIGSAGGVSLQSSWVTYDNGFQYGMPRFMVDAKGKVRISGIIVNGNSGSGNPMFTLPLALVPDSLLIFKGVSNGSGGGAEIRIDTSGNVYVFAYDRGGNNGYVALDEIAFFPASRQIPWTYLTPTATWANVSGFSQIRYFIDCDNIVHLSGVVGGGTSGSNITTLPAAIQILANNQEIFAVPAAGGLARVDVTTSALVHSIYDANGGNNAYISLEGMEYAAPSCTLSIKNGDRNYANSWASYASGFSTPAIYKDSANILHMRGLIRTGTAALPFFTAWPGGFKPFYQRIHLAIANNVQGRNDFVWTNQQLEYIGGGTGASNAFVSLANCKWFIEA